MKFEFDPPRASRVPLRGQKVTLYGFLSPLKYTRQLLLAKFFDLTPQGPPQVTLGPRGQGSNLNSLFRALRHEDLTLSICLGYYKQFPRSFEDDPVTNRPKSTRKNLLDEFAIDKLQNCSLFLVGRGKLATFASQFPILIPDSSLITRG